MSKTPVAPAKIAVALAAVYLVWGSTYLGIRIALETLPPFLMAAIRFLTAGSVLYLWARLRGAPRPTLQHWRSAVIIGAFLLLGGNGLVVWAEQRVESGLAALLVSTEPLWIVVLSWVLPGGRRPSLPVISGLVLGFIGVGLLVQPGNGSTVDPIGAGMLVLAALSWAYGSLWGITAKAPDSPLLMTGMQMLAGGVLQLLAATARGEVAAFDPAQVSMRSAVAVVYLMVFGSLVGFTAYSWLMRVAPPVLVSTYAYVNPVVAVLLGWAIASEPLSAGTLVAATVILGGVALITSSQARGAKKAVETPEPAPEVLPVQVCAAAAD